MKLSIPVANDQSRLYPSLPDNPVVGGIYAANDANFDAAHLSQPLNDYIVGVEDPEDLGSILESIAPSIPVGRAYTYRTHDEKEAFQTDSADDGDIREIGGDFPQVRKTGSQVDGRTDNKGLTMVLDVDQGGLSAAVQQRAVVNLRNRLFRSELRRVVTLLDANDSAESSVNWGPSNTSKDPDKDILDMLENSGDARGIDANVVLFGGTWTRRLTGLRASAASGAFATGALTQQQLADYYGVDSVIKLRTRFQSTATAKAKILTNDVYAYYVKPGAMPDDPSNIKRFVTATSQGGLVAVYVEQRLKKVLVTVEHYSRIVCASTLGIRKLPTTYT